MKTVSIKSGSANKRNVLEKNDRIPIVYNFSRCRFRAAGGHGFL